MNVLLLLVIKMAGHFTKSWWPVITSKNILLSFFISHAVFSVFGIRLSKFSRPGTTGSSVIFTIKNNMSFLTAEILSKNITNKILNLFYSGTTSINNRTVKEQKTLKASLAIPKQKPVANSIVPIKFELYFLSGKKNPTESHPPCLWSRRMRSEINSRISSLAAIHE